LGTHTHLLHRSCHCWRHRLKASFGIFRSSAIAFVLMSSMVAKRVPLRSIFRVRNSQKSLRARSEEYSGHFYVQVLQRLRDSIRKKRRYKWQGEWCLHHDNGPSHISLVVQQFLAEKIIPVITQRPYSPDLAPNDFWLFPTLKMGLKGTRFATTEDTKSNATAELRKIPKKAFPPVLSTMAGSMQQFCVCARVLL